MKDQLKKYSKNLIIAALSFLVCFLIFKDCGKKEISIGDNVKIIEAYKNGTQNFEKALNKEHQQVSIQTQNLISKDKEIEKELLKNSKLTKLNEQIKIKNETTIKNIVAQYEADLKYCLNSKVDTFIVNGDTTYKTKVDTVGIAFGTSFKKNNEWYDISGKVGKKGVEIESMSVNNTYTITVGRKNFKPKVEIINGNPYTNTISMGNVKVVENKKWYQNDWIKFGAGLFIGAAGILYLTK